MGWGDVRYCFSMAILVVFLFVFFRLLNRLNFDIWLPITSLLSTNVSIKHFEVYC
jgi:hypothetical protein